MLRLREERLRRGWSLTKLTVVTGINSSSLSQIERGKLTAFPAWRRRLAAAYGLPEEALFGTDGAVLQAAAGPEAAA